MPPSVLTYVPSLVLDQVLEHEFIENDLGDGYFQLISHEQAFNRADGTGSVSSYKGLNRFTIRYNRTLKGGLADDLWDFFRARLDAKNEAFYFYTPWELNPPDATGVNTTGRYLVRLSNPRVGMSRSLFLECAFGFNGLELVEERA